MTKPRFPDIKLPARSSKGKRRRRRASDIGKTIPTGMIDDVLLNERFERAQAAEDATRHLRVPMKLKLG